MFPVGSTFDDGEVAEEVEFDVTESDLVWFPLLEPD